MDKKFAAFDIETVKPMPEGANWRDHRPLGVGSVTLLTEDGREYNWAACGDDNKPIGESMASTAVWNVLETMSALLVAGYTLVSWNGLGFDLPVLGEEAGQLDLARRIALKHCDLMFQFFCYKGYPLGLDTAAKGMGLPGKTEGMHGDLAPLMWMDDPQGLIDAGHPDLAAIPAPERRKKVLEYLKQDVRTTLDVARAVQDAKVLNWTSRKGKPNFCYFSDGLLVVEGCAWIAEPDNSWMTNPIKREQFTGWLRQDN